MIKFFAVTVPAFHPSLFLSLLLFALLLLRNYFRFSNAILLPAVIPCPFPFAFFSSLSLSFSHDFFFIRDSCACIDCRLPLLPSGARPFSLFLPFARPIGCDAMDTSALSSSIRARTTNRPSFKYFQKESILRKYPRRACGNGDAHSVARASE